MNLPPQLRGARAAFVFLSRVPVGGFPYSPEDWRWAPGYFPLVGLVMGLIGAAAFIAASPLGTFTAAVLSLMATVWITGAFHEDGLADTSDAMGGAHSRKKLHEILKDSRIGTYGASALGLSLLLRASVLSSLPVGSVTHISGALSAPLALLLVHTLSRTGPVVLMAALPYVSEEGAKGSSVAQGGNVSQALLASGFGCALLGAYALLGLPTGLAGALVLSIVVTTGLLGAWFKSRAGGFTGDFLGATEQVLEMVLLLVLLGYGRSVSGGLSWQPWF